MGGDKLLGFRYTLDADLELAELIARIMKALHVLIATERFWPELTGWIHQTVNIAQAAGGDKLQLTSLCRPAAISEASALVSLPSNITVHRMGPVVLRKGLLFQIYFILLVVCRLVRQRNKIDVLFMPYVFFPGFVFLLIGRVLNIPTVARISGQEVSPNQSLAARLRFLTLRYVSAVVALNKKDIKRLKELGVRKERIHYIPNGVDTEKFAPVPDEKRRLAKRQLGLAENCTIVSFIGIICPRKGVAELIQAFRRVAETSSEELQLVLAGPYDDGVQEVEMSYVDKVLEQGDEMEGRIHITGKIDYVQTLLKASDIFVLPSYAEGMPNVLLEAMSAGLPCIATKINGSQDLITNGVEGVLVDPGNIDDLANALQALVNDSEKRRALGRVARCRIEENHSIDITAHKYLSLFYKVKM